MVAERKLSIAPALALSADFDARVPFIADESLIVEYFLELIDAQVGPTVPVAIRKSMTWMACTLRVPLVANTDTLVRLVSNYKFGVRAHTGESRGRPWAAAAVSLSQQECLTVGWDLLTEAASRCKLDERRDFVMPR